jgi:adenosylcobyric acid synthase
MKSVAVLGTSSNAGKSWLVTALGAWLRRQGVRVAPFKAQNMSNNSYVTLEGGEIGRAQAVQAIACGLRPVAEMNPILLKPSGNSTSQLVVLGEPQQHIRAADYYQQIEPLWETVRATLDHWKSRCDVLLLEGAGSPVELNLMHRDLVNLRPIQYLDGRWLLVGDIERGGIFAQMVGTYSLLPPDVQPCGLGMVVNKFRGDLSLFSTADRYFQQQIPSLPYLGTLPYQEHLQPESEDSLCRDAEEKGEGAKLAWIRFPYLSNSQDSQPWQLDTGVQVVWVRSPQELQDAQAIILPGSKNTLKDLQWLYDTGLGNAIRQAANQGIPIVGICGGYQMLCQVIHDPDGVAGDTGSLPGLGLLPAVTHFQAQKELRQVDAIWKEKTWMGYEIHMGHTELLHSESLCDQDGHETEVKPLLWVSDRSQKFPGRCCGLRPEGMQWGAVWGTYLHGLFESAEVRKALMHLAHVSAYQPSQQSWQAHQETLYNDMATLLDTYLDLTPVKQYLKL